MRIEKNPNDIGLIRRTLKECRIGNEFVTVEGGQGTPDFLSGVSLAWSGINRRRKGNTCLRPHQYRSSKPASSTRGSVYGKTKFRPKQWPA